MRLKKGHTVNRQERSSHMNNKVLYDLSYGVYITTAVDDGRPSAV